MRTSKQDQGAKADAWDLHKPAPITPNTFESTTTWPVTVAPWHKPANPYHPKAMSDMTSDRSAIALKSKCLAD